LIKQTKFVQVLGAHSLQDLAEARENETLYGMTKYNFLNIDIVNTSCIQNIEANNEI